MHVSIEDPDVVWMYERFADEAAFETHAVSPVHAEVTERVHELCGAGTEAYRLGLVAGKGLAAAP
ncbi:putative quinol monooxygenase [Streptomyces sp. NPDC048825]|uniref:putative quinol monooxygenase n=1 Tax=Streptomyces sp. NPDC048825 TaxID=3365592 RepID=UPI00371BF383